MAFDVAGGGRLAHRLELDRRVVEVGVDELVDERQVPACDVEQVLERLGIQGVGRHAGSSFDFIPATA